MWQLPLEAVLFLLGVSIFGKLCEGDKQFDMVPLPKALQNENEKLNKIDISCQLLSGMKSAKFE